MPVNGFPIASIVPRMTPNAGAVMGAVRRSINAKKELETTMSKLAWRAMRRTRDSIPKRTVTRGKMPPKASMPYHPPHTLKYTNRPAKSSFPMRTILWQRTGLFEWRVGVAPFSPMAKHERIRKIPRLHERGGVNEKVRPWKYRGNPYGHREPRSQAAKTAYKRKLRRMFATEDPQLVDRLKFWRRLKYMQHYPPRPYLIPGANKAIRELAKNNRLPFIVGVYFNR